MPINHVNKLTVAAHRGDSYNYPENTMSAFIAAVNEGCEMIETDVRLTKDMVLVLIHDATVNRTTNGVGKVADMTYEELSRLNAGTEKFPEKIPLFEDFIKWASDKNITVNIEIKEYNDPGNEKRCEYCLDNVLGIVEKYGLGDKILINSFDASILERCYKLHGKKYMLHGFYPYTIMNMRDNELNPDEYLYCACIFETKTKAHYEYLISRGIEAWVGASVTSPMMLEAAIDNGAKLITTNYPLDAIEKIAAIKD